MPLKRTMAPNWPIERKTKKYVVTPMPGPHSKYSCIPLGVVLRDILKYAETLKEAKEILNKGIVKVDGRIRKKVNFPLGLMDVFSVQDENYRLLPGIKGLYLKPIDEKEASVKLSKINNKVVIKNSRIQLNMFDGSNVLVTSNDYKTGDTAILALPAKSIKETLRMKKGSTALITGGRNIGSIGTIENIIVTKNPQPTQVIVNVSGKNVSVPKNYVFVVGHEKPVIKLG